MGKSYKQKKNRRRRRAAKLERAIESKTLAVEHGKRAIEAVDFESCQHAEDSDAAIKERVLGLLYAAALASWVWFPEGKASGQYATLAEHAFTMAGQSLETSLLTESEGS